MSSQTKIEVVDDLNGEPADELVEFALDGATYEIDLTADNARQLRDAVEEFVAHARRVRGRSHRPRQSSRPAHSTASPTSASAEDIRTWARTQGYEVGTRGRLSAQIHAAYAAYQAGVQAAADQKTAPRKRRGRTPKKK